MKKNITILVSILLFTQTINAQFNDHIVISDETSFKGLQDIAVGDIDGDGDDDIAGVSYTNKKLAWYENTNGLGDYGKQKTVNATFNSDVTVVELADIDGDGDIDIITGSQTADGINWFENLDGLGTFGPQQIIHQSPGTQSSSTFLHITDIDNDGDVDILSCGGWSSAIKMYINTDGLGNFSIQTISNSESSSPKSVFAADIDGDNFIDIITTNSTIDNDKVYWYKNLDGLGNFGTHQVISTNVILTQNVKAGDIDGDGDIDVVSSSYVDGKLAWYENMDGLGNFSTQNIINTTLEKTREIELSDIDNDGDLDIVNGFFIGSTLGWFENDGTGLFLTEHIFSTSMNGLNSLIISDIDNDGNNDVIIGTVLEIIAWYKNTDGLGDFLYKNAISSSVDGASNVHAADIDNDGDLDMLSASQFDHRIAWYENNDGLGDFSKQKTIAFDIDFASSVNTADIDGDGDLDILATSHHEFDENNAVISGNVVWFENVDSNFGEKQIIDELHAAKSVISGDIDNDGDIDVLTASGSFGNDEKIVWYENLTGVGDFSTGHIIADNLNSALSIFVSDFDNDNDLDLVAAISGSNKITWYRNDGSGNFSGEQIIATDANGATSVYAADIDNDGDEDVVASIGNSNKLVWFENTNSLGDFGEEQIITTNVDGPSCVVVKDMDNDGDFDVITTSVFSKIISWFENTNSLGDFGIKQIITTGVEGALMIHGADLNGDNRIDIISAVSPSDFGEGDNQIVWSVNQIILSNQEYSSNNLSIYPNPASTIINIDIDNEFSYSLYTSHGKLVKKGIRIKTINIEDIEKGIYLLRITTNNKSFQSLIIKE